MPVISPLSSIDIVCPDFDLAETLDCGQCFRWERQEDGSFCGIAYGTYCRVQERDGHFIFYGCSSEEFEKIWRPYFDLDRDYGEIKRRFSCDPILSQAAQFAPGIRVLRQQPWEALCSFILSQNNNIKRIKGLVDRLCQYFGEPVTGGFAFPSPERIACLDPDDLAPVRCGFRAKYIIDAAQKVATGEISLENIAHMEINQARATLMRIHGVGPKVAECALLYGFGRMECCPMDVWMIKCINTLFPHGLPECARGVEGIAQQYLFHYSRLHPELFEMDKSQRC